MNTSNVKIAPLVKRAHIYKSEPQHMRILQVFLNADLRGGHNSLTLIGKSHGIDLPALGKNKAVVFINKRRTLMKVYFYGNTFSFTRRDRIDLEAIKHLPEAFGITGEWDYDTALESLLKEKLGEASTAH